MTDILARVRGIFERERPEGTAGQLDQDRETAVSLGLMASDEDAGAEMTDEQAIFLSQSSAGMRARIGVLLGIPDRTLAQERELVMIQRELARIEGRDETPVLVQRERSWMPQGFLAAPGASLAMGILTSPITWIAAGVALVGLQTARLNNAKADLRDARADLAAAEREADEQTAIALRMRQAAEQADELSQQTAATIEAERARRLRAEREARSIRNALEEARRGNAVDYGFGGVRGAGDQPPRPASGDGAGGGARRMPR